MTDSWFQHQLGPVTQLVCQEIPSFTHNVLCITLIHISISPVIIWDKYVSYSVWDLFERAHLKGLSHTTCENAIFRANSSELYHTLMPILKTQDDPLSPSRKTKCCRRLQIILLIIYFLKSTSCKKGKHTLFGEVFFIFAKEYTI